MSPLEVQAVLGDCEVVRRGVLQIKKISSKRRVLASMERALARHCREIQGVEVTKKKKVKRTEPIKVHLEDQIVGRISGAKLLRCKICGDNDQTHLFASPLTACVICMKCAKEEK